MGDNVILSKEGKPFQSKQAALMALTHRADLDRNGYQPVEVEGGWGLEPVEGYQPRAQVATGPVGFRRIRLQTDQDGSTGEVFLNRNNEELHLAREEAVVVPAWAIEHLQHMAVPTYMNVSGGTSRQVGETLRYPYSDLGEATEEEFQRMLAEKRIVSRSPLPQISPITMGLRRLMNV